MKEAGSSQSRLGGNRSWSIKSRQRKQKIYNRQVRTPRNRTPSCRGNLRKATPESTHWASSVLEINI
jgi:hypothetical protein